VLRLPATAREVLAAGHELGNHSHTHPNFSLQSRRLIHDEFARAQEAIAGETGATPRWMRAPYGVRWFGFEEMQSRLRLTGVMWTVIGCDWRLGSRQILERIQRQTRPGAIICLHDGRTTQPNPDVRALVRALPALVSYLSDNGYHLETVTQLLCPTTN
jgi:peptidoglycan/xylan/chitin deacetylase (PgdA/CDA1 family)